MVDLKRIGASEGHASIGPGLYVWVRCGQGAFTGRKALLVRGDMKASMVHAAAAVDLYFPDERLVV